MQRGASFCFGTAAAIRDLEVDGGGSSSWFALASRRGGGRRLVDLCRTRRKRPRSRVHFRTISRNRNQSWQIVFQIERKSNDLKRRYSILFATVLFRTGRTADSLATTPLSNEETIDAAFRIPVREITVKEIPSDASNSPFYLTTNENRIVFPIELDASNYNSKIAPLGERNVGVEPLRNFFSILTNVYVLLKR